MNKKILQIISLVGLTVFTAISCTGTTVAWFLSKNNTQMKSTSISLVKDTKYNVTHRILSFDQDLKKGVVDSTSTSAADFSISLNAYDCFIPERNDYLSQIIEFNLTPASDNTKKSNVTFTLDCTSEFLEDTENGLIAPSMSNIIQVKSCLYSYKVNGSTKYAFSMKSNNRYLSSFSGETEAYVDSYDKYYQEVRYHLSLAKYTASTFISESSVSSLPSTTASNYISSLNTIHNYKKTRKSLTFSVPLEGKTYLLPDNYTAARIYVEIDYSKTLANAFAANRDATILSSDTALNGYSIAADFTSFRISVNQV